MKKQARQSLEGSPYTEDAVHQTFKEAFNRIFENSEFFGGGGWNAVREALVALAGIQDSTARKNLKAWSKGERLPSAKHLAFLCTIFGRDPDAFFAKREPADQQKLLDSNKVPRTVKELPPDSTVYIVAAESRFHSDARKTVGRFHTMLDELGAAGPQVTVLLTLPHQVPDGNGEFKDRGGYLLELLKASHQLAKESGKPLPYRYFFLDPAVTSIDPMMETHIYIDPGRPSQRSFREVLCYVKGDTTGHLTKWVEVKKDVCEKSWNRIREGILPICNPPWKQDRLEVSGRDEFRALFQSDVGRENYRTLEDLRDPCDSDRLKFDETIRDLFSDLSGDVKVLEVGAGNFKKSWELFYQTLEDRHDVSFHVTSVDPSPQDPHQNAKQLRTRVIESTIEEYEVDLSRFDLVVCCHAVYRSDPGILTKMLALVRPGGLLLVVHASTDSFLHKILRLTDDFVHPDQRENLKRSKLRIAALFDGDYRKDAPFRVFARELVDWLEERHLAVKPLTLTTRVSRSRFFPGDGPTEEGGQILQYLLGLKKDRAAFLKEHGDDLAKALDAIEDDGELLHEELFFWLKRMAPPQEWLDETYPKADYLVPIPAPERHGNGGNESVPKVPDVTEDAPMTGARGQRS